jgi:cytochrome c biogenesis protein CcmG, thiol:disulfide interchange protein DsbE
VTVFVAHHHARGSRLLYHAAPGIIVLLLLGGGLAWLTTEAHSQSHPSSPLAIGQQAPDFTAPDTHDNIVALQEYHGRPVVLNFWATWCAPCRRELPVLQAVYEAYQDKGLVILAISQDTVEKKAAVRSYIANLGITFPPLLDPEGSVAAHYNVFLLPSTIFINPAGTVVAVHFGPMTRTQIDKQLVAILPQQG